MLEVQTAQPTAGDWNSIAAWYAEVANPILMAASEALEGMAGLTIERGRPSFRLSAYTEGDITVAISVEGAVKGIILLELSYRTAFHMLQQMLGEELNTNLPISDFLQESELARSALQEIANILAGRSAMHLEGTGKTCVISPPELLMRRGVLLSERDFRQLIIPLNTEAGELNLAIALSPSGEDGDSGRSVFVAQHIIQPRRSVVRYDFSNPEHLGRTVYAILQQVHERYQQLLSQQVGIRMRMGIRLSPARLEKDTFINFLQRDYQWSVGAAFNTTTGNGVWILAISQSLSLMLIDRMLGGPGKAHQIERNEWTPLERALLNRILGLLGETYAEAWQQYSNSRLSLRLMQVFTGDLSDQTLTFQSGGGALLISHRLQVGEETGVLQWILPTESLSALISKRPRFSSVSSATTSPLSPTLRLTLHFGWQGFPITMNQLQKIEVGTILPLQSNFLIWCKGRVIGTGKPYRRNGRLVAKVVQWKASSLPLLSHPDDKPDEGTDGTES
ncbi:MAG: chemotaxis protein CheX [Armatimonadetes bacterium]|nr:chemotaxis protein CheX [Armatimonadota bacterium]MCX7968670.1 chemotaxis protein CheX [Armatimonadota bacterium]MDW8143410.1 chemotaxis protein CheX [Armatimonadota bacterium]